jgi:H+-transporting ATPase
MPGNVTSPASDESSAPSATSLATGLLGTKAPARLERYGSNEVPQQKPRLLRAFVEKFWGLSAWMIEIIIGLSLRPRRSLRYDSAQG